jgi:hypothetical protein
MLHTGMSLLLTMPLQKRGVSAAKNDGFTRSCLWHHSEQPLSGMVTGLGGSPLLTSLYNPPSHRFSSSLSLCSLFSLSLSTLSRWPTRPASHDTALPGPARPPPRFSTDSFEICLALDRHRPIALPILDPLNFLTRSVAAPFEPPICPLANMASARTASHPPLDKPSDSWVAGQFPRSRTALRM